MSTISFQTPFELEKLREHFAKSNRLKAFRETYLINNVPEIQDSNTSLFWDNLLLKETSLLDKSPIFIDKMNKICAFLSHKKGKLLNVGFGTGTLEKKLEKVNKNIKLFGIDISNEAVKNLSRLLGEHFVRGNILKIPFRSSCFDFVFALDVLEHIPPSKVFRGYSEMKRVLKKGGFLVLSVPLNEGLEEKIKEGKNPNSHLRVYTPNILKAELKIFKFKVLKEIYLFAFRKNYLLKTFLTKLLFSKTKEPNLFIVIARK